MGGEGDMESSDAEKYGSDEQEHSGPSQRSVATITNNVDGASGESAEAGYIDVTTVTGESIGEKTQNGIHGTTPTSRKLTNNTRRRRLRGESTCSRRWNP